MRRIVFLASGGGGNLKFFHLLRQRGLASGFNLSVIADRECGAVEFSERSGIPARIIEYSRASPNILRSVLVEACPDVVITNWHKIVDAGTVSIWKGRMINLHYSLLPAFAGLIGIEPIVRAHERGCRFIGPTCHFVDEGVDTGRIISQGVFETDGSIERAIGLMFRIGCSVLLDGVEQVIEERLVPRSVVRSEGSAVFLPADLRLDTLPESFWAELSVL